MIDLLSEYWPAYLKGLANTIKLLGLSSLIGLFCGLVIGVLLLGTKDKTRALSSWVFLSIAAIPALVVVYWFYFPFQKIVGFQISGFWTAIIALSLINMAAVAELVLNIAKRFPKGFLELERVTHANKQKFRMRVLLPYFTISALPGYLNIFIFTLHATLFAGLISVEELFRVSLRINSEIYNPILVFSMMAIFFALICIPIKVFAMHLEKKFDGIFKT